MREKILNIVLIIIFTIIIVVNLLSLLGLKTRTAYLNNLELNINKTLELNNITNIKAEFTNNNDLIKYIETNKNINIYSYNFRISYKSKIFRNSDIYNVIPNLEKTKNMYNDIKHISMDYYGSPFGYLESSKFINNNIKMDNIEYILKVKKYSIYNIIFILIFLILFLIRFEDEIKKITSNILKNKNILSKISISLIILFLIIYIIIIILGNINRICYLDSIGLDIDKTLEVNNLLETKSEFTNNNNLIKYIETNKNINLYVYNFRISYNDKIFRNNDIYNVIPNLEEATNRHNYIKYIDMEHYGSPFGYLESSKLLESNNKIDDIRYSLKTKFLISIIFITIIVGNLILFLYSKNINFILKYDIPSVYFLLILIYTIMYFICELYKFKLNSIIIYNYGDFFQAVVPARIILDKGWAPIVTEKLGAPFGAYIGLFPLYIFVNFEILLMKIISLFGNFSTLDLINIAYFSIFPITGLISFYVMRNLSISRLFSIIGSLQFAFLPFIFFRKLNHFYLSVIYFIPLTILLCIWIYENNILVPKKDFIKNKKNLLSIFFIILIANNGESYYQFFTCFLICVTAICKLLEEKNIKSLFSPIIALILTCFFYIINFIPLILYKIQKDIHSIPAKRLLLETELYGFKISHFFLNPEIFNKYYSEALLVNENASSYSGIIAIFGIVILFVYLFIRNVKDKKMYLFSRLNIAMILLTTIGGFNSLFSFFITPILRSYNRISVYIAYISIVAFFICINKIIKKKNFLIYIFAFTLSIIFIKEQVPSLNKSMIYDEQSKKFFLEEKRFVEKIEKNLPSKSAVYQLPSYPFTDTIALGKDNRHHYKTYIGYIFSKNIKWSTSYDYGSKETEWFNKVNQMKANDLLNEISYAGFNGLYIDKYLFADDNYIDNLINDIKEILNQEPMKADNGNLIFFNLSEFKKIGIDRNYTPLIKDYIKNN